MNRLMPVEITILVFRVAVSFVFAVKNLIAYP